VDSPEHGVPFITGGSVRIADISRLPLLSKRDACSSRLSYLRITHGMSLISCAGTIGTTAYVRPEIDGIWSSQDVLKVVPDPAKIHPGYLYAFLSSKFGVPLVASGTYGAIIQHLESEHIAGIPVPRFDPKLEGRIHDLVEEAAQLRTNATTMFREALKTFHCVCGLESLPKLSNPLPFGTSQTRASELALRLDTHYHSRPHQEAVESVRTSRYGARSVSEFTLSIVEPLRFKRVQMDGTGDGTIPFFGTASLMQIDPEPLYSIPARGDSEQCRVALNTLLVPRSGQVYGVLGTSVLPIGDAIGGAVTEDAIRINCRDTCTAGFLYIALNTESGLRQMKCRAFGGSIPHLDVNNVGAVLVPDAPPAAVKEIGNTGAAVANLRTKAIQIERQARACVEDAIERVA
jgi:type I restriction enzyme S subunit